MQKLLPLFLLLCFIPKVWAQTYFDFTVDNNLASSEGIIEVKLNYNLKDYAPEEFRVRPKVAVGEIYIWDYATNSWIYGFSNWNKLPTLTENTRVKLANVTEKTQLYFQLLDTNGFMYETPKRDIWPFAYKHDYFTRLNAGITTGATTDEEVTISTADEQAISYPLPSPNVARDYLWLGLGAFVATSVASFLYFRFKDNAKIQQ